MPAKSLKYSANDVYSVIKSYKLTSEQQRAVEEASTTAPSLIVAGAGSGKTELMSVRVLWLVANSIAKPEEILGLTFTRKAANELNRRIYESLLKLRTSEFWPEDLDVDFKPPTIATYNSYANNLFRDWALGLGHEPDSTLLTDAGAFQLAREVVIKHGDSVDSRLSDLDLNLNPIVEGVLAMAQTMNDNLTNSTEVEAMLEQVREKISSLPKKPGGTDFEPFAYTVETLQNLANTPTIARLADAYRDQKRVRSLVDYSDQVALAELAVRTLPAAAERERTQFSQVLLDEYQDTSFLQTRLLSNLFAHRSVYAVGDPNQSIYGWRGASAANLNQFSEDFGEATHFSLSTSWRNPRSVLALANRLAAPLTTPASFERVPNLSKVEPVTLEPRPGASEGTIEIDVAQDVHKEAQVVAAWFAERMNRPTSEGEEPPTNALLLRKRQQMQLFVDELQEVGIEVQVVGLGGLMEMPEIVDLVSALKVIHDPTAGTHLIRLLAGPRWRIGARDIERLFQYARQLARDFDPAVRALVQESQTTDDSPSLVDALDSLVDEKRLDKIGLSDESRSRLIDAGKLFRNLRSQIGLPLPQLVQVAQEELWLDVEVAAHPHRQNPMANLNAFSEIVAGFADNSQRPTLRSFLDWLSFADEREKFELPSVTPTAGVVQVLTIHAAKGLEWDNVAIANLVEDDFPAKPRSTSGWIKTAELPYPLRGDRESLPIWHFESAESQKQAKDAQDAFKEQCKEHLLREELRLMYVAVTRPKESLLLTASYWKPGNKSQRRPSRFLDTALELVGEGVTFKNLNTDEGGPYPPVDSSQNELNAIRATANWPLDPLGQNHRLRLQQAAIQVQQAIEAGDEIQDAKLQSLITRLLAEQDERMAQQKNVEMPVRISASKFKDFVEQPEELAKDFRRPMPHEPYKATRAGTLFHEWAEARLGLPKASFDDGFEENDGEIDFALDAENLERLAATFENSRFSTLIPIEIEREVQLSIGQNTFVCKLDAVFSDGDNFEIVDWKTGKAPNDKKEIESRLLQLALYRVAYARFANINIEQIKATLYYVAEDLEISSDALPGEQELMRLFAQAVTG